MNGKELRRKLRARAASRLPGVLSVLPEGVGRELCAGLGWLGFWWVGRDRRLARENLKRVYPDWPPSVVERTARAVFRELGRNVYDFLRYPNLSASARLALVDLEGKSRLDAVRASGRGAVIVTAHLGAFEILAGRLTGEGYPLKAMARPIRERRLEGLLTRHRERMDVATISALRFPRAAVRHLERGGFLGVLMDQRVKSGGTVVRFLGQPTRMTDAPARLALATGAPLVPVTIQRGPGHRHRARVFPPVEPRGSAAELTQALAATLESVIRECPAEWMWFHPRWTGEEPGVVPESTAKETACAAR
jgi:Kdo2-lipid IVA lauroyltransferase/acyltransferase